MREAQIGSPIVGSLEMGEEGLRIDLEEWVAVLAE
jgi:hypothetical protein